MSELTILVCDDETHLREMVAEYLSTRGFKVVQAENAQDMRDRLEDSEPDLILLDIRMPNEDGLTALRNLRTNLAIPVIMLTATSSTIDRVVGLELGADDYLGKPVDLRELEARIGAVMRRQNNGGNMTVPNSRKTTPKGAQIAFGDCTLDVEAARLIGKEGEDIPITAMEFTLLILFSENARRVLTRDQILDHTDERGTDPFDRSIDLRISRLRRKIERHPTKPEIIRTVRGLGYMFEG